MNAFLSHGEDQRKHIKFYSDYFLEPVQINDEEIVASLIEQLETIGQQWNIVHHKQKRDYVKENFAFFEPNDLLIDYETCLNYFEQQKENSSTVSQDEENKTEENKELRDEVNAMSFDECLDYLKIIGEIFCFGEKFHMRLLVRPYFLLNGLLSNTIFRPNIDHWLNYDHNMVFRFSGFYPSQTLFDIDRERLLTRGEFTWRMLNVLFYEQNNNNVGITERDIFENCRLMERLFLGYLNRANLNCKNHLLKISISNIFFHFVFSF